MKLEGSLDAFGLADVFHLLQATSKTGALWLRRGDVEAAVHLEDGRITAASLEPVRLTLLRRLVVTGSVDEDAIAQAAGHAAESGCGLVAALLACELADPANVAASARGLAVDAVFDLLRWPDGDFSFAADERTGDDVGLRLSTSEAVEEARSRLERWEAASTAVPSPSHVLSLTETSPEHEVSLSAAEWSVLALVDGRRTIQDLVDLSAVGAFDVVTVVAELVARGLVHVSPDESQGALQERLRRLDLMRILDVAASSGDEGAEHGDDDAADNDAADNDAADSVAANIGSVEDPALPVAERTHLIESRPARPEQARITHQQERPEPVRATASSVMHSTSVVGANAVATSQAPDADRRHEAMATIAESEAELDPAAVDHAFNRSLVLRLIAGVRGL